MSAVELPRGPVVLGIEGTSLTADDRARLLHPLAGSVVLFARNFESCAQLKALTASIRALRRAPLLICVDHEGGARTALPRRVHRHSGNAHAG